MQKVAEMYEELRRDSNKDTQHFMPVKPIPNLEWEKEQSEPHSSEKNSRGPAERKIGPTLRSSKNKCHQLLLRISLIPTG